MGIHHATRSVRRAQIEALVERLVDILDRLDGDPDFEDGDPVEDDSEDRCTAGDDGCGCYWAHGVSHWGAAADGGPTRTIYGSHH